MRSVKEIFHSYEVLDSEGRHVNGTDKEGPNHSYGDAYESLFTRLLTSSAGETSRDDVKLVMEIGVTDGSCLYAWHDIFPNAHIVGMDIHPCAMVYGPRERIEFHLGDQRSKEDCDRAAAGRQFDLIVEDATHILENTLLTLLYMWPHVKKGGLYVIEEFANIGALVENVTTLFPNVRIINTGSSGRCEPLVVLRKW